MSWDAGAFSNFGALNFASIGGTGGGGGPVPSNLVVSTLTAAIDISSNSGYFNTITSGNVACNKLQTGGMYLAGLQMPYTYGGFASTSITGLITIQLPFNYADTNYKIIVNYADVGARLGALDTYGLMGIPNTINSFDLVCTNTTTAYGIQYITCGSVNALNGTVGTPELIPGYTPPNPGQNSIAVQYLPAVSSAAPIGYTLQYSINADLSSPSESATVGSTGARDANVLGLSKNTTYYFRGKVSDGIDIIYSEISAPFTTLP